ncbi:hypothetical protein [Plasmodium yoelii yoelii]|uniref:Uncharacterized protein n=1 Tax=Plasmodium yoelii yoelii TaxID=73239 RepID=Q7RDP6_PLAYO|nr:hypothetical protein [Plasmodium yoelii yoelii]
MQYRHFILIILNRYKHTICLNYKKLNKDVIFGPNPNMGSINTILTHNIKTI